MFDILETDVETALVRVSYTIGSFVGEGKKRCCRMNVLIDCRVGVETTIHITCTLSVLKTSFNVV